MTAKLKKALMRAFWGFTLSVGLLALFLYAWFGNIQHILEPGAIRAAALCFGLYFAAGAVWALSDN